MNPSSANGAMQNKHHKLTAILLLLVAAVLIWWFHHIATTAPKDKDYLACIATGIFLSTITAIGFAVKK